MDKHKFYEKEKRELWDKVENGQELTADQIKTFALMDIATNMKTMTSKEMKNDKMLDTFAELEAYYHDYMKHKQAYEQTRDPAEKQHMLMELKQFMEFYEEIYDDISKNAQTPEEKQYIERPLTKL